MKYFYNKKTISFVRDSAAITIQCRWRGYIYKALFLKKQRGCVIIQLAIRRYIAYRIFTRLKKDAAALKIQSRWRGFIVLNKYLNTRKERAAITIQHGWRSYLLHEEAKYMETLANNIRNVNVLFNIVWPKYDVDGRGIIEAKETTVMLQDFTGTPTINKDDVHTFLVSIDEDKNGKIDQNELVQYIVFGLGMSADEMTDYASRGHFQKLMIDFFMV